MAQHKKLIWKRLGNSYGLICLNPDRLDKKAAKTLLRKIEVIYDDFKKPLDQRVPLLFQQWLKNTAEPLPEAFYCLLSNWFLGDGPANISIRAGLALLLWRRLFCAIPEQRLTKWRKSDAKVFYKDVFDRWWKKQQDCKDDC